MSEKNKLSGLLASIDFSMGDKELPRHCQLSASIEMYAGIIGASADFIGEFHHNATEATLTTIKTARIAAFDCITALDNMSAELRLELEKKKSGPDEDDDDEDDDDAADRPTISEEQPGLTRNSRQYYE